MVAMGASSSTSKTKTKTIEWVWDDNESCFSHLRKPFNRAICTTCFVRHPSGSLSSWHVMLSRSAERHTFSLNCWNTEPDLLSNGPGVLCEYEIYVGSEGQSVMHQIGGGVGTFTDLKRTHEEAVELTENLFYDSNGNHEPVQDRKLRFRVVLEIGDASTQTSVESSANVKSAQELCEDEPCR